ncbi:hypothetical protein T4B_4020 [Trichinella pseudospiralis]|nr:hypothetical protein T4A_11116 [Trichinella pseudospiralis]KRZ18527.1 hypothetical protein T4B_4020 [Trichinella pseudospiralis]KRZ41581.1 hypothetical protein T4C_1685 [Trichinella pseudospiralis]
MDTGNLLLQDIFANEGNRMQLLLGTDETTELAASIMFSLTTQVACENGGCATWVRATPLQTLPLLTSSDRRPTVAVLRRIEFVYLDTRAELIAFLNGLHSLGEVVDCLLVDGLQAYCDHEPTSFAGLLATAQDLANWIGDRRPAGRCPTASPPVLVSCSLPESQHPALRTVAAIYTDCLLELKKIHNNKVEIHRNGKLCCLITVDKDKRIFQIEQTQQQHINLPTQSQ